MKAELKRGENCSLFWRAQFIQKRDLDAPNFPLLTTPGAPTGAIKQAWEGHNLLEICILKVSKITGS